MSPTSARDITGTHPYLNHQQTPDLYTYNSFIVHNVTLDRIKLLYDGWCRWCNNLWHLNVPVSK